MSLVTSACCTETCWHVRSVVAGRGKADIGKAVLNKRVSKARALQLLYPPADSLPRSGLVQDIIRDA